MSPLKRISIKLDPTLYSIMYVLVAMIAGLAIYNRGDTGFY